MKSFLRKLSVLIIAGFLCLSCGRKAPPRLPTYEPPPVPVDLTAVQRYQPRHVLLLWKDGSAGRSFVVERAGEEKFARVATVTEQHFIDTGLDADITYRYRVRGISEAGVMGDGASTGEVSPVPDLKEPTDISFDISGDTVKLDWDYPGDMSGPKFNIYRRKEGEEYPLSPVNSKPISGNVFEDQQNFDETVYYSVRFLVTDDVPTEGPPSADVRVGSEDYVPAQVTGVEFAVTKEKVLVFWDENPEPWVRGYRVYRAGKDGIFHTIGTSRTPAFEDTEQLAESLSYRVGALGPAAEGPPSESIVVQPAEQP